ncbi:MAG: PEP-CTERM sorting domain-containing protein [Akkermansiaceae bacterium]|nr:PEP-CTERM sorting domain-containing protein [Akkermansiaceae bacterium]
MKKTLLTIMAMTGVCAASTATFDFKPSDLTETGLKNISYTDPETLIQASISVGEPGKNFTLVGGNWADKTGPEYDYIAASGKTWGSTLTLTFSGLTAGAKYNVSVVTGVPFEDSGSWNKMNLFNEYETSSVALGSSSIKVRDITLFVVDGIVADDNGNITFKITKESEAHTTSFNYATIEQVEEIPEPTTATLSLLALAGLAVRRRRR